MTQPEWMHGDPATLSRLLFRYNLLKQLIVELHNRLAETQPDLHKTAPPANAFLEALDQETFTKSLEQMGTFVDRELKKALRDSPHDHPIRAVLKQRFSDNTAALIPQIAQRIQHGDPFQSLMEFLAQERRRIAEEACDLPTRNFGTWRESRRSRMERTIYTSKGRFKHYLDKVLPLIPEGIHDFVIPSSFERFVGNPLAEKLEGFSIWTQMQGQQFPLSTYLVCRQAPHDMGLEWMFSDDYNAWPSVAIVHTEEMYLPFVRAFCSALFDGIRNTNLPKEALIDSAAILQWYLAHGMFFTRGSAAIAEWLIAGLLLSKNLSIKWTKQPDLEALCCLTPEEFASRYRSFSTAEAAVPGLEKNPL